MDIGNLVTQDNANEGKWFQLVLYGRKQPVDIKILGEDSDEVQQYLREKFRKVKSAYKGNGKDFSDIDDDTLEELLDSAIDDTVIRISGVRTHGKEDEPVTIDGRVIKDDDDSYRYLVEKIPNIKDFVLTKSKERTNFLADKKKN